MMVDVRIGRMALDNLLNAIETSVEKAVDDFWEYHRLFPYQEGINLPSERERELMIDDDHRLINEFGW